MLTAFGAYIAFALTILVSAQRIILISVGGSTAGDATKVFQPQNVTANQGDVVYFNFTQGNHTATQSFFASPCISGHTSQYTFNGFDSGFRDAGDGSGFSDMLITILDPNTPMWFFDYNTCGKGGVGVINAKNSGNQTFENFRNNALNINGTGVPPSTSTSSQVPTNGSTAPPAQTRASSDGRQATAIGISTALPLVILALSL